MISVAAYLASLTGAAPAEDQKATAAGFSGAGGIFAALLESTGNGQPGEGETGISLPPSGISPPATGLPSGAADTRSPVDGAALGEALAQGLGESDGGAGIDAVIVEDSLTSVDPLIQEDPLQNDAILAETAVPAEAQTETVVPAGETVNASPENPIAALQDGPTPATAPDQNTISDNPEEAEPANAQAGGPGEFEGASAASGNDAVSEASARPTGLENALNRASPNGRENGLQIALSRTAQARGAGETQAQGTGQSEGAAKGTPDMASDVKGGTAELKPETGRPSSLPKGPEIVQRLIRPETGQSIIRIQNSAPDGEIPGASSPPTLTVSVQAPTAPPGPAQASAPHVPVSAMAVYIAGQAQNGAKRFDIRLDPPELGRVEVRLDMTREGQVTTHLVVERSETLDLLQRDARHLERALQNAGLDTSEDGMTFSLKDQGLAEGGHNRFGSGDETGTLSNGDEMDDTSVIPDNAMPPAVRHTVSGGIDIRI